MPQLDGKGWHKSNPIIQYLLEKPKPLIRGGQSRASGQAMLRNIIEIPTLRGQHPPECQLNLAILDTFTT